nr:sodium/nucleoside cotransporter 1-like isoform X4 [Anser cygnoides]
MVCDSPQEGSAASIQGKALLQGSCQGTADGLLGDPWSSLPVLPDCGLLAQLPASPCLAHHNCCGCLLHLMEPLQEVLWGKGIAAPQPRSEMLPKVLAMAEMVSWRAVFWGLALEFLIGLFILRTTPGIQAFQWLGDQIQIFLGYTKAGSVFVFGNTLVEEVFAFQTLPIVVFFSCVMSILYYLGAMQWLILKISWLLQISMGTTPTETLSVAGNIFVGQTEAPLLIRPYLADMTYSEIHAVMTGGFSTIAGSVMGAYISFGIDAASLIAASVMAAPCALAMSKLVYPEVEESKFKGKESIHISGGEEQNILEAASSGAAASVGLVANIAANLIAFLAVLEFINAALLWFGEMVNIKGLSFQMICSYVLMPVAFLMGADWADSPVVAELLGIKIFLNEFVAYQQLATYKKNRLEGLEEWNGGQKQWISVRATATLPGIGQ